MRIGILGTGAMGKTHAAAMTQTANAQVTAFATRSASPAARALAQHYGAELLTPAEVLAHPKIDAVVIATPTDTHLELVRHAAGAGKHIFCEKPLARTLAEGAALLEATERAGVRLAVGQVVRYFAAYAAARDAVLAGTLGSPEHVRAMRGGSFPTVPSGWYADTARSGGVALDLMIHDFDWARWTFGPVSEIEAHEPVQHKVVAKLHFAGGLFGEITGSWAETSPFRTIFTITGSAGQIAHDSWANASSPARAESGVEVPASAAADDPYVLQMRDAIQWLRGGNMPRATGTDALEALRLSLAAIASLQAGKAVDVA